MKHLWLVINELKLNKLKKDKLFLVILIWASILFGVIIWLAFGKSLFPGISGLFCFMGYPAFFVGFIGGILYIYNHEF